MLRNINLNRWISLKKNIICFEIVKNPSLQRDYCSIFTNAKTLPSANCQQLLALDLTRQSQIYFVKSMSNENTTQTNIKPKYTNRLAETKSPYLLQHANNPVDWYPWCSEAIEKARKENKLIFLSVGYSTCHWCHVMEHESFENEGVAKIMNEHFVNIKVDREERPDIDKLYMNFLLMVNGSGGWPMSVWLTPDLAPIAAGTYFPPKDRYGMPSFETVLKSIAHKWNTNQEQLKATGLEVISEIKKSLSERQMDTTFEEGSADEKLKEAISIYKQRFDKQYGGFGSKPKFPEVPRINFLFHAFIITKDIDVLEISLRTLQNIGKGGIHDHIIGGFARYAVDQNWHIPHFEKMLYDQGQLLSAYSNAFKLTADPQYLEIAEKIFTYSISDLRHPDGAFYAGEDADSLPNFSETKKIEGAFYAWNWDEIKDIILKNGSISNIESDRVFEIYAYYYGLKLDGNVHPSSDPQGHLHKKNILYVSNTVEKTLKKFSITSQQLTSILNSTNEKLLEVRKLRPRPHLDTKVICSWNGLMLSGLSKLISCGSKNKKEHLKTAEELCRFVKQNMFDMQKLQLRRTWYGRSEGEKLMTDERDDSIYGFLDDYAFWIKGLLDFYKISLDDSILEWAKQLQDIQDKLFWDDLHGGYFYSQENSDHVAVRLKEDHDGAEPCGNSVAAHNLLLMSHYFDDSNYRERAVKLFNFFSDQHPFGYALPEMMTAFLLHEHGTDLVAIVGPEAETTDRFIEICQKFYVPGMVIVRVDPNKPSHIYSKKLQDKFKMVNNKPTVYICHNKVCRMPIVNPDNLEKILLENFCHPKF